MPNGGHPAHMLLKPRASAGFVLHCYRTSLRVIEQSDPNGTSVDGRTLVELDPDEVHVLVEFLSRWITEQKLIRRGDVRVAYDY